MKTVPGRIVVEGISKRFRLGERRRNLHLREALMARLKRAPRAASSRQVWALRDVSFDVEPGEIVGIVGRNGAGKSTLLRVLARITEPTAGAAYIHGRVGSLLEVGTGFHPDLTGRENVFLNGAILGMSRAEIQRNFDRIVDFSEVGGFLDTPVKRYSSGMRMRLAFSVAAHLDPEVLIVDEVLAVGDAAFQKRCLGRMQDIAGSGRTVLFVSHNMAAVEGLCSRGLWLEAGRIASSGEVRSVIHRYLAEAHRRRERPEGALASSPDGTLEVRDVALLDAHEAGIEVVQCGQPVAIRIRLRSHERLGRVAVQLAINDSMGARVAVLGTELTGRDLEIDRGESEVTCRVGDVSLVPDFYTIELKVLRGTDTLIFERRLTELPVEAGDFFESGRLPKEGWGGRCLLRHSWDVEWHKEPG